MIALAGKAGRFQTVIGATTVNHEFSDWTLTLDVDIIEANGFEKTADGDGNYWKNGLAGLAGGTAHVKGRWNSSKSPINSFKPGSVYNYSSVFLGLTTANGFTIPIIVKSIRASQNVKDAADFEAEIFINGAPTYAS